MVSNSSLAQLDTIVLKVVGKDSSAKRLTRLAQNSKDGDYLTFHLLGLLN